MAAPAVAQAPTVAARLRSDRRPSVRQIVIKHWLTPMITHVIHTSVDVCVGSHTHNPDATAAIPHGTNRSSNRYVSTAVSALTAAINTMPGSGWRPNAPKTSV